LYNNCDTIKIIKKEEVLSMTRDMYMTMMDGLVATIKEKALVGGQDDRVRELVDIVDDLQDFWNGDEEFTRFDYNISAKAAARL